VRLALVILILLELAIAIFAVDARQAWQQLQAAVKTSQSPHWEDVVDCGLAVAAVANVLLLLVLGLTAGKWTRSFNTEALDHKATLVPQQRPVWQRGLWVAAWLAITVWYGSMSFAGKSLWWDELWQMRQASHGSWKEKVQTEGKSESSGAYWTQDKVFKFSPTSWKRCAFYYQKPTNHVPMALLQKASFTILGQTGGQFSDLTARLPALLVSSLAVLLAFRYISHLGGVASMALLLMLHPWHLRYGVEARAYALLVLLCLSALLACRRVIHTQARDWRVLAWLGVNQAVWIWAFPFAVINVALLFFATLWLLSREHRKNAADRFTAMLRLVVTHVFAAALVFQLFFPCLLQLKYAHEKDNTPLLLDAHLLHETFSQLAFGMEWKQANPSAKEVLHLTSSVQVFGSELLARMAIILLLAGALLGLRHLLQRLPRMGLITLCPLIGSVVFMLFCWKTATYFYPRFIIAALPIIIIGLAEVPVIMADYTQNRRKIGWALVALFALATMQQRAVLRTVPYTAYRDIAKHLSSVAWNEKDQMKPVVLCLGIGREALPLYYPTVHGVTEVAQIEAAVTEVKSSGRPLLIVQGYTGFHRVKLPEAMKLLEQSGRFTVVQEWPGLEANFAFKLWQLK
jgi:hypothetical protein